MISCRVVRPLLFLRSYQQLNKEEGRVCILHLLHIQELETSPLGRWPSSNYQRPHVVQYLPGQEERR